MLWGARVRDECSAVHSTWVLQAREKPKVLYILQRWPCLLDVLCCEYKRGYTNAKSVHTKVGNIFTDQRHAKQGFHQLRVVKARGVRWLSGLLYNLFLNNFRLVLRSVYTVTSVTWLAARVGGVTRVSPGISLWHSQKVTRAHQVLWGVKNIAFPSSFYIEMKEGGIWSVG